MNSADDGMTGRDDRADIPDDGGSMLGGGARRGSVPASLPRRPGPLRVVVGIVAFEAAALLASAIAFLVLSQSGGEVGTSLLALCAMFAILAAGLGAVVRSLWLMHRWARPATIAWQILQALFGFSTFQAGALVAGAAIVPAIVCIGAMFAPSVIRAFDIAGEYHAANPSTPAPPPKRW